jgi:hypothetical protein
MSFSVHADADDFDVESNAGRTFGISVRGSVLRIEMYGLKEDSDARFPEDQYAPHIELVLNEEESVETMAALQAWVENLASREVMPR